MSLQGKVVMITGAAGTLGRAAAGAFAAAGTRRVLLDIQADGLEKSFGKDGDEHLLLAVDLGDAAAVAAAVATATKKFGRIDVLVNIAGGFRMGQPVHETDPKIWHLMIDLNAGSVLTTARAVVPGMIAASAGKIINIGAMGGTVGRAHMGAYAASKSAVIRLTESMAAELREHGINVNCILPSIIDTPVNRADMPDADPSRWVAPEQLADLMIFLASDKAKAIHGAAIPIVGLS